TAPTRGRSTPLCPLGFDAAAPCTFGKPRRWAAPERALDSVVAASWGSRASRGHIEAARALPLASSPLPTSARGSFAFSKSTAAHGKRNAPVLNIRTARSTIQRLLESGFGKIELLAETIDT